ncbi:TIGR00366 family protein, partial [Campylobacter helveticus]
IAIIVLCLPFLLAFIHPTKENTLEIDKRLLERENKDLEIINHSKDKSLAVWLENSFLVSAAISTLGFVYIVSHFAKGGDLDLNVLNMIFLFLGILLHKKPALYIKAINTAAKNAAGILLQFPFYAGIIGMMIAGGEQSLASVLSHFFISISNSNTFALFAFWSAGFVNIFVPSGGGQWAVQAPIMIPAGLELGISPAVTSMAIAWGDAWTNMIQPFWALPALAIAGLGAKDIMGYCVITLLFTGLVISLGFLFLV